MVSLTFRTLSISDFTDNGPIADGKGCAERKPEGHREESAPHSSTPRSGMSRSK